MNNSSKIYEDSFVIIADWMTKRLKLKGNDLLVYALIYGFTKNGTKTFYASRDYIADTFGISTSTVDRSLKTLLDKKLITKMNQYQNGLYTNSYRALVEALNFDTTLFNEKNTTKPVVSTVLGRSRQID